MTRIHWIPLLLVLSLLTFPACGEEGPMEKAGRKLDDTVGEPTGDKGPMEELGERFDAAIDAVEDLTEDLGEAAEDFGDKITD